MKLLVKVYVPKSVQTIITNSYLNSQNSVLTHLNQHNNPNRQKNKYYLSPGVDAEPYVDGGTSYYFTMCNCKVTELS